jgi:hypothetical protein
VRRRRPPILAAALVASATALAAGCGSGSSSGTGAAPAQPKPTAAIEDFPKAAGLTLGELRQRYAEGPIFAPSTSLLEPGSNRMGFALYDNAQKQLSGAAVALYAARSDGTGLRGPFVARSESMAVKPQFQSRQTAEDPNGPKNIYVSTLHLPKKGKMVLMGLARLDGRLVSTTAYAMTVGPKGAQPPGVGDQATVIHTLTPADVGGDLAKIDTRIPPAADLLATDFADVVGKKPVVLTFATPQLCQSRVCGPVVDVVEQARASAGDNVAFIHQEVYNDNQVKKGVRSQLAAYHLATEPWTFVIDRRGVISSRFEGALSVGELERAVAKVR